MIAANLKGGRAGACRDKTDEAGRDHYQRKGHGKKENADESERRQDEHWPALQGAASDPLHGLQHDRKHRGLEAQKQRGNRWHAAERGIDIAERHDRDDAGYDKKPAGNDGTRPAMHQPADIDRQLMGFRPRQQHAVAQCMQKPVLADPFLLVDNDPVHDRDLTGWAAKTERGHAQPDPKRFTERDAVAMFGRPRVRSDRGVGHGARSPPIGRRSDFVFSRSGRPSSAQPLMPPARYRASIPDSRRAVAIPWLTS